MAPTIQIKVVGLLGEPSFHCAKSVAEALKQTFPSKLEDPIVLPLLEYQWREFVGNIKQEFKGEIWDFTSSVMCFLDGHPLGNEEALLKLAEEEFHYKDFRPEALYLAFASDFYTKYQNAKKHTFVFLDISIDGQLTGRMLFELFSDICPKTCKNFQALCTGEMGTSKSGLILHYKGSIFHRLVKNGWIQGGDIAAGRGNGGESIYGPVFEDESFAVPHKRRGVLGMSNKGRHTNGSQFYITLQPATWMDTKYVAFGYPSIPFHHWVCQPFLLSQDCLHTKDGAISEP
ncbi:probable inactive peptidyl-prolyl cis-trans isomerase-like 6 isoform X2 [Protopterus annectens]|uniref:probable inactive peptidyl-prolyl cis-trans isomerase-like 6 isoform X2 n=1 Tax=Protopterus annectens TaxID=7888 RepID=UPI001CF9667C|nr:probable inactive peptidyl-prolyl cis-trans isomerase-like 6 isoform X2 [Protopterus annectens]